MNTTNREEGWESQANILFGWGIAPPDTLKEKHGEAVKSFIRSLLSSEYQRGREEVVEDVTGEIKSRLSLHESKLELEMAEGDRRELDANMYSLRYVLDLLSPKNKSN